jgi:hypothetical protein
MEGARKIERGRESHCLSVALTAALRVFGIRVAGGAREILQTPFILIIFSLNFSI